jgi:hypothetical protein
MLMELSTMSNFKNKKLVKRASTNHLRITWQTLTTLKSKIVCQSSSTVSGVVNLNWPKAMDLFRAMIQCYLTKLNLVKCQYQRALLSIKVLFVNKVKLIRVKSLMDLELTCIHSLLQSKVWNNQGRAIWLRYTLSRTSRNNFLMCRGRQRSMNFHITCSSNFLRRGVMTEAVSTSQWNSLTISSYECLKSLNKKKTRPADY